MRQFYLKLCHLFFTFPVYVIPKVCIHFRQQYKLWYMYFHQIRHKNKNLQLLMLHFLLQHFLTQLFPLARRRRLFDNYLLN